MQIGISDLRQQPLKIEQRVARLGGRSDKNIGVHQSSPCTPQSGWAMIPSIKRLVYVLGAGEV
ncbi:MAG: hypothetical protein NVSMB22_16790 [Chloroflexota bacterium]